MWKMSKFLFVFCALLPLGGLVRLSLAAQGQREKRAYMYTPSAHGDAAATSSTVSGSIEGAKNDESPYLVSEGETPEVETEKNEEPYSTSPVSPTSPTSPTENYQKHQRHITALKRACLYVLIVFVMSFIVHEAIVYPKVRNLQEVNRAATGTYLPEDEAYDQVLSKSYLASYSVFVVGLASTLLVGNLIYRAIRALLTLKYRKRKNAGEVQHQGEEQQQIDDVGDQQGPAASEMEMLAESASAGDVADTGELANEELGDAIKEASPEVADIGELDDLD